MSLKNRAGTLVRKSEEDQISRNVLSWLNTYPDFPDGIRSFQFEMLKEDNPCMALSTIQGTYITETDITGCYTAEYQFKLVYRAQPSDNAGRLEMDEILDAIGDWAVENMQVLELGTGKTVTKVETSTRSALFGRYDNGDEDHQIMMKLTYEVSA